MNAEEKVTWPATQLLPVLRNDEGHKVPLSALLKIDPSDMISELRVQAAWQAVISYQTTRQEVKVSRLKREVDKIEAGLFIEYRAGVAAKTTRAPGVELIKSYVAVDPRLTSAQDKLFAAEEELGAWKAAISAMHARRECLINMGADLRIDKKGSV